MSNEPSTSLDDAINPNHSPLDDSPRYRVFISYSHDNRNLAQRISDILRDNGLQPMWDKNFAFGQGFHEQIRNLIAHALVFLPILTEMADARKWVHQEIGYSMALHIPVVPVAVGNWPGAMIEQIHAIEIQPDGVESLREHLTRQRLQMLIERHSPGEAYYTCADLPDIRARMMARYAEDVLMLGGTGVVRQKGGLSSFHIPTQTLSHPVWHERYGQLPRGDEHYRCQREERLAFGRHAAEAGCILIINPELDYAEYGVQARLCRLKCLRAFLDSMPDDRCRVAIKTSMKHPERVTLVGNWFAAESVSTQVGKGYRQTIFTRHAPTVMEKLTNFDSEFAELLDAAGVEKTKSRRWAIKVLDETIASAKA